MLTVRDKLACRFLGIIRAIMILAIFLGFSGNATGENRRTVLLLPFRNMVTIYGPSQNIRSPINGRVFISGPVDDKAVGFMNAKLHALLLDKDAYALIPAERAFDILTALSGKNKEPIPERELWVEVGRILGADAVMGGFIYRFKNRIGTDYGVDDAASVAFGLHLIRVSDGRIQWSGRVDETQQPLSNNLFKLKKFLSRGGRWVTSREMAQGELKSLIAEMPEK